jgi:lysine-ketoglutarate reductase/saccharopine dehydrogenase-like protein (TIGR00300 family)
MSPSETVHLDGHIIDSGTLSKVLDLILLHGGDYEITTFQIGTTREAASHAEIVVRAPSDAALHLILQEVGQHGANPVAHDAEWVPAPADGVFPPDFYSTTNLESYVRHRGQWLPIEQIEMDCGVTLVEGGGVRAVTTPVHRIKKGDRVLVHEAAVKVVVAPRKDPVSVFGFMSSEVSAERPKELTVAAVAEGMRENRREGKKILFVGGPAIIHTGAGRYLESLIADGWIDVLFAGNALATHDIEAALLGTSLGVKLATGVPMATGHNHHLRAINAVRAAGSIRAAVEQGVLTSGVMHACVKHGVDFVLAGSIRDDGPLPDVITNTVTAQDEMRARVPGVGLAIMVATTLHSVATGNLLPATVRIICVDNNTDTITKLMDRGTRQAFGLVTDCQFFLKELAARLAT